MWLTVSLALGGWRGLAREELGEPVEVNLRQDALRPGLLQPRLQLCAQDVDLPVQQAAAVRDLLLLLLELVDHLLEVFVRERCEIGQRFHEGPFGRGVQLTSGTTKGQPYVESKVDPTAGLGPPRPAAAPLLPARGAPLRAQRTSRRPRPPHRRARSARPGRARPAPSRGRPSP